MIHFVGAGSGAPDLITVRGQRFLREADVVIYAGSLVNPELLKETKPGCEILNSAYMTLDEVIDAMEKAEEAGKVTVRLHTGDPAIYGAIREQMDRLDEKKIAYDVCPGVSSFCGAASSLHAELTLPGVSQSVIITRMARKKKISVPWQPTMRRWRSFSARVCSRRWKKSWRKPDMSRIPLRRSSTRRHGRMRRSSAAPSPRWHGLQRKTGSGRRR